MGHRHWSHSDAGSSAGGDALTLDKLDELIDTFARVKEMKGPRIIHIVTKKGKGFPTAESKPELFHGIGPYCKETGDIESKAETWTSVFGDTIVRLAKANKKIIAITAGMCLGTGLKRFREEIPDRFFAKRLFYDAVYQAITDTSVQIGQKAVIAMTDGRDNASGYSHSDVISHAQSSGVPVFTIGLGKSVHTAKLQLIAEQTGGLYFEAPDSSDLASIYQSIAIVLRNQYVITFDSSYRDGLSHAMTIMAVDGGLYGSDEEMIFVCQDSDFDGLSDAEEDANGNGIWDPGETNFEDDDTDDDGLKDGEEKALWGDDWNADFDGDGVINILDFDSDGDGFSDGEEVQKGTNPGDPDDHPRVAMPWIPLLLSD